MVPKGNKSGSRSEVSANKMKGRLVTRSAVDGEKVKVNDFSGGDEATVSDESEDGKTSSPSEDSGEEACGSNTMVRSPPSRKPMEFA